MCADLTVDTRIGRKIRELFVSRGVVPSGTWNEVGNETLAIAEEVQRDIYEIDYIFEETDQVTEESLSPLWAGVKAKVGWLSPGGEGEELVARLQEYQDYELRIHEGDRIHVDEFYWLVRAKCGDVALAREVVNIGRGCGRNRRVRRFAEVFDAISEVVEDWRDWREDLKNWNFNCWLYGLREEGGGGAYPEILELLFRLGREGERAYAALNVSERARWEARWRRATESIFWIKEAESWCRRIWGNADMRAYGALRAGSPQSAGNASDGGGEADRVALKHSA